jgi:hypothetical protein
MAFYLTSQRATILKHPKWGSEAADLMPHLMDVPSKARGFLLKLSSKKKWVKRFFHLRGHYLIYFGSVAASRKGLPKDADENHLSSPDGAYDLRCIRKSEVIGAGEGSKIILQSNEERTIELMAISGPEWKNIARWHKYIAQAIDKAAEKSKYSSSLTTTEEEDEDEVIFGNTQAEEKVRLTEEPIDEEDSSTVFEELEKSNISSNDVAMLQIKVKDEAEKTPEFEIESEPEAGVVDLEQKPATVEAQPEADAAVMSKSAAEIERDSAASETETENGTAEPELQAPLDSTASADTIVAESLKPFSGMVSKSGHTTLGRSFQRRKFVLDRTGPKETWEVRYFKGAEEKGKFSMRGASVELNHANSVEFTIRTESGKSFPVRTETVDEAHTWIEKLNQAIAAEK